jgi:hypothetical protein
MRHATLLLAALTLAAPLTAATRTLYVAPNGNDAAPGTRAAPFATLERARDEARKQKQGGPVEIAVRGGRYRLTKTFALTAADSGSAKAPVVYKAYRAEKPVFTGGVRVTGFEPVRDPAILARLPEEARGKVMQASLKALGVSGIPPLRLGAYTGGLGFQTHPLAELFFDGQPMQMARWPNQGFVRVVMVVGEAIEVHGRKGSKTGPIYYDGDRPLRWKDDKDALLYGYFFWDWADSYERIAQIETADREIRLEPPYAGYGYRAGQPYYAINLLSEIDVPGEWYLDRASSTVYLYPPSDPNRANVELSVAMFPFVTMESASYVNLVGLTWELGGGDAVLIHGGDHCLVAGCTLRRFGGNGVEIQGGEAHAVRSSDIYSMGRGGVVVDAGNRKTLKAAGHIIENCEIYDLSRIDHTYTPAVLMSGVGNRIVHNAFHDVRSSAIRLNGNDHLVEFNEVYRVVVESDDQGGVDMHADPTFRGNVIRNNYWHHIGNWRHEGEVPPLGQAGIRLDDAISGVLLEGNVFYRCGTGKLGFGGLQIHGGKDNQVRNNVFAYCRTAMSFSPWGEKRWKEYTSRTLKQGGAEADLYLSRYSDLARLSEDYDVNFIRNNVIYNCGEFLRRESKRNKFSDNLETRDNPGFAAPERGDFSVRKSAPALARTGFKPIPFEKIGLYRDQFRKTLPAGHIRKAREE